MQVEAELTRTGHGARAYGRSSGLSMVVVAGRRRYAPDHGAAVLQHVEAEFDLQRLSPKLARGSRVVKFIVQITSNRDN